MPYTGVFFQAFRIVAEVPANLPNGIVNFQKVLLSGSLRQISAGRI